MNIKSLTINGKKLNLSLLDSYHNASNTEGYRVYSDGWCECYGLISAQHAVQHEITLPKSFKVDINSGVQYSLGNEVIVYTPQLGAASSNAISGAFTDTNKIKIFQMNEASSGLWLKYLVRGYLTDFEMGKYE